MKVPEKARVAVKSLKRLKTESFVMVIVLLLAIAALPVLYYLPKWQADSHFHAVFNSGRPTLELDKQYIDVENEARKTLAQIVLGVFGLVAVYLTWVRTRASDLQARVAQQQAGIAEQGLMTDRFTKAIEQLGAVHDGGLPKIEVRLGAIYALERLARDSVQDHWTIMEVLCAYIRENAPWVEPAAGEAAPNESVKPPRTDVQAALTVIGRREMDDQDGGRGGKNLRLDLRNVDLREADGRFGHLHGANLGDAHLEGASLWKTHLEGAALHEAHLEGANLREAHLEGALLIRAHLEGALLIVAHLEGALLIVAHLEGAHLIEAHLEGARLLGAHLEGADLLEAHLEAFKIVDSVYLGPNRLTLEQVRSTKDWEHANWSPMARVKLGLPPEKSS